MIGRWLGNHQKFELPPTGESQRPEARAMSDPHLYHHHIEIPYTHIDATNPHSPPPLNPHRHHRIPRHHPHPGRPNRGHLLRHHHHQSRHPNPHLPGHSHPRLRQPRRHGSHPRSLLRNQPIPRHKRRRPLPPHHRHRPHRPHPQSPRPHRQRHRIPSHSRPGQTHRHSPRRAVHLPRKGC